MYRSLEKKIIRIWRSNRRILTAHNSNFRRAIWINTFLHPTFRDSGTPIFSSICRFSGAVCSCDSRIDQERDFTEGLDEEDPDKTPGKIFTAQRGCLVGSLRIKRMRRYVPAVVSSTAESMNSTDASRSCSCVPGFPRRRNLAPLFSYSILFFFQTPNLRDSWIF